MKQLSIQGESIMYDVERKIAKTATMSKK